MVLIKQLIDNQSYIILHVIKTINLIQKFSHNLFHFNLLKSSGGTKGPLPAAPPIEVRLLFKF